MLDKIVEARILASMNFKEADRVPIWDLIDNRGIVDYLAPGVEDYNLAMAQVYHKLGIDLCRGLVPSYKNEDEGEVITNNKGDVVRKISGKTNWKVKREIETVEDLKRYKNLILVGNVDCSVTLPLGTVEDVIEATKECIRQTSRGGGHFIGSSSEIVPSTPVENIIAFYQTAKEFGKYPISI